MTAKVRINDRLKKIYLSKIRAGRFSEPEEISPAFVCFLALMDVGYITGQVLGVDGGYYRIESWAITGY